MEFYYFGRQTKNSKYLFPSGVFFDSKKHNYLTKETNSFLLVTKCILNYYEKNIEQKKGTNQNFSDLSHSVA